MQGISLVRPPAAGVRCFVSVGGSQEQVSVSAKPVLTATATRGSRPARASWQGPLVRPIPGWKRPLDVLLVALVSPAFLLILAAFSIYIKLVSRGPVFFVQERVGYGGKVFRCLKFRTMHVDNDGAIHKQHLAELMRSNRPMSKLDQIGDARIIPMGGLLRASGLDELPQLINVLRGEMSLVGPRPCLSYEFEYYKPWQKERIMALPGLTGLWQVSGKNRTTFDEMICLDIRYARNPSFLQDLKIMARTIPALLSQMHDQREARRLAAATLTPARSAGVQPESA
jgi:exopolysaccharide production protein ExoY